MSTAVDWPGEWPPEDLESLGHCPVCENSERTLLFDNLTDVNQRCAPGRWALWRCHGCGCGYLDPRPTAQSIVCAYANYPTHEVVEDSDLERRGPRRLAASTRNSYLNRKYGARRYPTNSWAWTLLYLLPPPLRWEWDYLMRHIPRPSPYGGRLLDVGCGNGDFMALAKRSGWNPLGLDFDPGACQTATERGLEARCGGLDLLDKEETFDYITLGHVIEHVHDAVAMLREIWKHLSPGGTLWFATPNLSGPGFSRFGAAWASLETPRHLHLFDKKSLLICIKKAQLPKPKFLHRGWNLALSFAQSENIEECGNRLNGWRHRLRGRLLARAAWGEFLASLSLGEEDELVVQLQKPSTDT